MNITEEHLTAMEATSYRNFHAKGLDYICLNRSPTYTVKLYFFERATPGLSEVINPHDHRYPFRTTVLAGRLRNTFYVPRASGTVYQMFEWRTPLLFSGTYGFKWVREQCLLPGPPLDMRPGEGYWSEAPQIHTIDVVPGTVIKLVQHADVAPPEVPTTTYSRNKEPPSLDGLYERFPRQELLTRLKQLPEHWLKI